jgi:hypothetical protein
MVKLQLGETVSTINNNCVNKANLLHNLFSVYLSISLRVSDECVPIIRRNNCVYATLGTCYFVWMTVWYAGWNERWAQSPGTCRD